MTESNSSGRLPRLDAKLLSSGHPLPDGVVCQRSLAPMPERVLQIGEGVFLRGFVDWMLERMNAQGLFRGRVVVVQPRAGGKVASLAAQDGLYTVVLRGIQGGAPVETREIVSSISRCVNPFEDFEAFLACARQPELRFIVSNTTEAGIRLEDDDRSDARPAHSFPAKLTQFLHERFRHFGGDPARGVVLLPCELIDRNGDQLKRAVEETARRWQLPPAFGRWLDEACVVTNTLVDRIVPGFPRDEAEALAASLGYEDPQLVTGEPFHLWVIEGPPSLAAELPLAEAGLDVIWTRDVTPYRDRKVRILNGAHTMIALAAYLSGKDTVREVMEDELLRQFVERGIHEEILPTLSLPRPELVAFAASIVERFANPHLKHQLISISLSSVSKFRARILGTMTDYWRLRGSLPSHLTFALAALIAFYRGQLKGGEMFGQRAGVPYPIRDEPAVLQFFHDAWADSFASPAGWSMALGETITRRILARVELWGQDLVEALPGLDREVARHLDAIFRVGMRAALEKVC